MPPLCCGTPAQRPVLRAVCNNSAAQDLCNKRARAPQETREIPHSNIVSHTGVVAPYIADTDYLFSAQASVAIGGVHE